MATYDVIVGNIGTVRSEVSLMEARSVYRDYVHKSKAGEGRAAGESVTILNHETGEPDAEYEAPESGPAFDVYVGDINGICLKVGDAVNRVEAREIFQHYINRSKADYGEHAGKPVTITNTYTDSVVESYEPPKGFGEYDPAGSYKIVRMFERGGKRVIKRGLTLAEAQAWCKDPRTSSKTATDAKAAAYTRAHGPWFDGWEDDKKKLTSRQRQSHARHKSCQRAVRKAKTAPSSARFVIGRLYSTHSGPDSPMKILVGRVCASAPEFWGDRTHIGPDCLLKLEGSAKVGERYPVRDDGVGPLVCVGDAS